MKRTGIGLCLIASCLLLFTARGTEGVAAALFGIGWCLTKL